MAVNYDPEKLYDANYTLGVLCSEFLEEFGPEALYDTHEVQKYYRDAKIIEIYDGTREVEKITIARRLF